jgi:hypothetical protein
MTTNRVKLSTGTNRELLIALRSIMQDLKHRVVKDQNHRSVPVMNLLQMAEMYVVQSSDNIHITKNGKYSLKTLAPEDFLHTKSTLEKMGITKGRLPHVVRYDGCGGSHEAYMRLSGSVSNPFREQFKRKILNLSTHPATLMHATLEVVGSIYKKYIVEDDRDQSRNSACISDELEQF